MSEAIEQAEWLRPQEIADKLNLKVQTVYQLMYLKKNPPSAVVRLPGYRWAKAINWTAIKDVPRVMCGRKRCGYDWTALQPKHQ